MEFTGERFVPNKELMNDEIAFEHLHRYHNATELVKGKIVLDIACGEGYGSAILSQNAAKVFGIDIDQESVSHAKEKYKQNNIEFICGSVENIPLPDDSVDVVISYETIEHIDEETQNKFLLETKRVLKKKGLFVISTPDKVNYSDRYSQQNEFHLKEFEKKEFIYFLKKYFKHVSPFLQGYEIVDAITEQESGDVNKLTVINWPRKSASFSRKYIIAVCADIHSGDLNFSSIVFNVDKNFLELMDGIVSKEKHILELGNWGKKLDKEIEGKNQIINNQQQQIAKQSSDLSILEIKNKGLEEEKSAWINLESYLKELTNKQAATIENLSFIEKERFQMESKFEKEKIEFKKILTEKENQIQSLTIDHLSYLEKERIEKKELEKSLTEKENRIQFLQQSHANAETDIAEKNIVVSNQNQTINFLKIKIEEYSRKIQSLEQAKKEKEHIVQQQKEKEQSLYLQLDSLNIKWSGLNERLDEIYNSEGWKFLSIYYKIKGKLIPEGSKRYEYLKRTFNRLRGKKEGNGIIYQPATITISHVVQQNEEIEDVPVYDVIEFKKIQIPVVSIVIPVFNGWKMTYKCLKSIYENTISTEYEIIIADDGATDETKNIKEYIKNITVIRNEKNLGFLDNCNNASKTAKGKFILFLNNDTEVRPAWLSSMVELMEKDESIGMTGSKFIYPDGRLQEAGGIIWKDASGWNFGNRQFPDQPEFNYVKETDYISGACILIRKNLWEEIGGFDRRYAPAYCEDSDLAFEVRKRGFKVVYQPLSEIIHYEGFSHGTDETGSSIKGYQKINNQKFREKWNAVLLKEHFENGENVFWAKDRSRNKQTVLVIDHYVPHFDKDAGSKTVFQYLKLLVSLGFNVKFIGDNFYRHEPYTTVLQQMGIEVLYGPWYANNWQSWIKSNHDKFDYVLLNRPHISAKYMDFIKENTNAKILYYGHDLHFIRLQKQYEIENKDELFEEAKKWKQVEISLFNKSDLILTPSKEEKDSIKQLGVTTPAYAIKPYIFDSVRNPVQNFSNRKDILFVGGFTHTPNVDAVTWFVKEVWPLAKQKIAGAHFFIVGSNVTDEIASLADDEIKVIGFVSEKDLQKLYNEVKLAAIPLRYGAGVKGKTVEAMYHGIPLVATSVGIEGLPGDFSFLKSSDTAVEFANELTRLYNASDDDLISFSKKEVEYIQDHFHFDVVKSEFNLIIKTLSTNEKAKMSYS